MSYPGIDYGLGQANIEKETGIRYGVISQNSISPYAFEDIMNNGTDVDFENFKEEVKSRLESAIEGVLDELGLYRKRSSHNMNDPAGMAEEIVDNLEWDNYEGTGDCTRYLYEQDGYVIETCSDGDMFITKSPYYSKSQYCSPCAPGAGYLNNPCEDGPKTFCLGLSWFDEDCPCEYPIYRVDNDERVFTPEKESEDQQ
jgi:hypothetical protein